MQPGLGELLEMDSAWDEIMPLGVMTTNVTMLTTTTDHEECVPVQVAAPDLIDSSVVQAALGLFYALTWLFGVLGNLTVLYMVLLRRVDFTVRTVFILSLAISDLLIGFTSLPVTAVTTFSRTWVFTDSLCYSIGFLQASSVFASSFTLITIAIDRYYLIYYPHSVIMTYEKARVAVLLFWCVGSLFAIPMSAFAKIEELDGICGKYCVEQWPEGWTWGRRAYGLAVVFIQYGLPLVVCSTLYMKISYKIHVQYSHRLSTERTLSHASAGRCMVRRKRTNRMMAAMVLSFVLAWMPINVVNLARDFDVVSFDPAILKYFTLSFAVGHLAAMSSLIWNPIIYSWFNYKFRRAVKNFMGGRNSGRVRNDTTTIL